MMNIARSAKMANGIAPVEKEKIINRTFMPTPIRTEDKCILCHKRFRWKEVVISYLGKDGDRLDFCLECAEETPDNKKRKGVKWGVHQHGISEITYLSKPL